MEEVFSEVNNQLYMLMLSYVATSVQLSCFAAWQRAAFNPLSQMWVTCAEVEGCNDAEKGILYK